MLRCERLDLQLTSAMYPRALVKAVSKIPAPSGTLLHHCHSHMYVKVGFIYVLFFSIGKENIVSYFLVLSFLFLYIINGKIV